MKIDLKGKKAIVKIIGDNYSRSLIFINPQTITEWIQEESKKREIKLITIEIK